MLRRLFNTLSSIFSELHQGLLIGMWLPLVFLAVLTIIGFAIRFGQLLWILIFKERWI